MSAALDTVRFIENKVDPGTYLKAEFIPSLVPISLGQMNKIKLF
jgi:hypothetical protein